ncbi:MAG: extracellular solute-binding protein [Chloroflexi bacterium]|nr:extracellular solute-binding protein [Chloroflexota bacterium]
MSSPLPNHLSRRNLLKLMGASLAISACAPVGAPAGQQPAAADKGAASPAKAATEVVMMYIAGEIPDPLIKQFNQDYAPINLTRIDVDPTRFYAMFAAGEAPDLVRSMAPDIPQLLGRKMLLNLQSYFDTSNVLKADDMQPVNNYYRAGDPLSIGQGPLYGMVKDWAPDAFIWVNEAVFEKVGVKAPDLTKPVSETDIKTIAHSVTVREGNQTKTFGFDTAAGFIDRFWMSMAKAAGGSLYTDDFTAIKVVGNEPVVNAIKFYFDLAKDGVMTSPLNPSPAGWFGPDFTGGRLGIVSTGYWFHGFVISDPGPEFQQAVAAGKVKMYPDFTWYGKRSNPCITAAGAVITSSTKHPDAAWTAFEWFMGKEPAQDRAKSGWGLPSLTSLWNLIPKTGPLSSSTWTTVQGEEPYSKETIQFNPYLAGGEPMVPGAIYQTNLEQALKGEITFDELLSRIESETNTAIQEGKNQVS